MTNDSINFEARKQVASSFHEGVRLLQSDEQQTENMIQAFFNYFKDEKFNIEILGDFGSSVNILLCNDEAL